MLITALQYVMRLAEIPVSQTPWQLPGRFLTEAEVESTRNLPMHQHIIGTLCLSLAVLFDAPLDVQQDILHRYETSAESTAGIIYGTEWDFLSGMIHVRTGDGRLKGCLTNLLASQCEWVPIGADISGGLCSARKTPQGVVTSDNLLIRSCRGGGCVHGRARSKPTVHPLRFGKSMRLALA